MASARILSSAKSSSKSSSSRPKSAALVEASKALGLKEQVITPAVAVTETVRMGKLPIAKRIERQIALAAKRWTNLARITKGWAPALDLAMAEVGDSINAVTAETKKLPADFAPRRKSGGAPKKVLDVGSFVDVTDKAIKHYEEIIAAEDLKGLVVKRVSGKKIVCKTVSGETVILPRQHVAPAADEDAVDGDDDGDTAEA